MTLLSKRRKFGGTFLLIGTAILARAQSPLALEQTQYELRPGTAVQLAASGETLNFLLKASSRRAGAFVVGPNRAGDQVLLAASLRTKPGTYTVALTAADATGAQRQTTVTVNVSALPTVPSGSTRPPVVLLNGWETGFTNACAVSASSSATFGNLASYLVSDGVPVVYFFDNCAEDPNQSIETLANDLGQFLNSITFDNGTPVTQIDLVAHSMGGLIARAYLAGLQPGGTLTPPGNTLIRDMVLIATPNFGSFVAGNQAGIIQGAQSLELIPGSAFLWNLATWNQRSDDLRGVNAIAVIGNAGTWLNGQTGVSLGNASDGLVSLASASLDFVAQQASVTRIVPYCHIDPAAFSNASLPFTCSAPGIANVTDPSQLTGQIVRSFLGGTSAWSSIGSTPATDPYLDQNGGTVFATVNATGGYVSDVTQVTWGTVTLQKGGDANVIYYDDFVSGTGDFQVSSSSLGTINCGTLTQAAGYVVPTRCKIDATIISIGPLLANTSARIILAGSTLTINGADLGYLCNGCKVVATPAGSTSGQTLTVSSWTSTAITAVLPAGLSGLVTIAVLGVTGNDATAIYVAPSASAFAIAVAPSSLQFSDSTAQSIQIANSGSGTLSWTASTNSTWLSLSPASGTAPSTLSVTPSLAGLSAGTYTGTVMIAASGASNTPVTVTVTLTVAAVPALTVTPASLSFQYMYGGALPGAQTLSIVNAGGGTISLTVSASTFWLGTGAAAVGAPVEYFVSVNPANLAAGTYTGSVQVSTAGAAGSPVSIPVSLVVQGSQPAGTVLGMLNAASFQTGFASGTWVSIFGTGLSATTYTAQSGDLVNGALPTSLEGVSVTINGVPAYVDYISPTQINALAPDDPATGAVQVQVTTAQQTSNSITVQKQSFAPAFFTTGGGAFVAAQHADYTPVGPSLPAHPGEIILMYGTGFGPSAMLANNVQIMIGGVNAQVNYGGLAEPGIDQFNVVVPMGLPNGNASVVAAVNGVQTQTGISITFQQ